MNKTYLTLSKSEIAIVQAAATIYAAHVQAGGVTESNVEECYQKSVEAAIQLASRIDEIVVSDGEMT